MMSEVSVRMFIIRTFEHHGAKFALNLIDCACPDGWLSHGENCYHFSHDRETFPGAKVSQLPYEGVNKWVKKVFL